MTVLTGRASAGKTGAVREAIRGSVDKFGRATLLVPSYPDAVRARAFYAAHGPAIGLRIDPLRRHIESLWLLHGDGRLPIDDVRRTAMLSRAIRAANLEATAISAGYRGFSRVLSILAKSASVAGPPKLSAGVGKAAEEIAMILGGYRSMVESEGLVEPEEMARSLAGRYQAEWTQGLLALNDCQDLTFGQEAYLRAAADAGTEVLIALTWEKDFPATNRSSRLVQRLGVQPLHLEPDRSRSALPPELVRLADSAFRVPAVRSPSEGAVRLSLAAGDHAEDSRIAAEVLDAIRSGTPPGSIAVVFRDAWERVAGVLRELREAGVTASADLEIPFAETGLGRALAHLHRAHLPTGTPREVGAFLRTPYSGAAPLAVGGLERTWRRDRTERASAAIRSARRVLGPAGTAALIKGSVLVEDRCRADGWEQLVSALLASAFGNQAAKLDQDGRTDAAAARAAVDAARAAAGLVEPLASGEVMRALMETAVGVGDTDPHGPEGRVLVTSMQRLRGRRFALVVVGGLDTAGFSSRRDDGFLSDPALVAGLERLGVDVGLRDATEEDRALLYSVCTRATTRLVLSRRTADASGRELGPAPLLDELLDLYRDPSAGSDDLALPVSTLEAGDLGAESPGSPRTQRRALRECAGAHDPSGAGDGLASLVGEAVRRAGRRSHSLGPAAVAALSGRRVFSASELEAYTRCPYGWFRDRAIGARSLDAELGHLERGTMLHEALRLFYSRLPEEYGAARLTAAILPQVRPLAERCFAEARGRAPACRSTVEEAEIRDAERRFMGFLARDSTFLPGFAPAGPDWLEHRFGEVGTAEDFGGFELRGQIDRVDVDGSGRIVVVDYKSTVAVRHSVAKWADEGIVQMPLYMEVARRRLGAGLAAGLYRQVRGKAARASGMDRGAWRQDLAGLSGLTSTDAVTAEGLDAAISAAIEMSRQAVDGIRAGEIPAKPRKFDTCTSCRWAGLCGGAE